MRHQTAAFRGLLLLLPFLILNAIVANRIQPFFSWIRPGPHTSLQEVVLLGLVLLLLPAGAWVALRPIWNNSGRMQRHVYVANLAVAALLIIAFSALSLGLGSEIYACEVLRVPNCD